MPKADKNNAATGSSDYMKLEDKIDQALLNSRRLFLSDAIDNESANEIIKKTLVSRINPAWRSHPIGHQQPRGLCRFRFCYMGSNQDDHFPCYNTCHRSCRLYGVHP